MKLQWIPLVVMTVLNLAGDVWLFLRLRRQGMRMRAWLHALLSLLLLAVLVTAVSLPRRDGSNATLVTIMWLLYTYYACYGPRYAALLTWLPTHTRWSGSRTRRAGAIASTALGLTLFAALWWGALVTPRQVRVNRVDMEFDSLPPQFDGYRIAQFSDTHLGTYNGDTTVVSAYIDSINALGADLICFTGDLVNRDPDEALPYTQILARLHAPHGVAACLGNHDDGTYRYTDSTQCRNSEDRLMDLQRSMGWRVLRNDTMTLRRDSAEVLILGTECMTGWPFPKQGSLDLTLPDYKTDRHFKILLQHNPAQWRLDKAYSLGNIDERLVDHIHLMLSGHTHAMQCMVTLFGRDYSPAGIFHDEWGGTYERNGHRLYVNIGLGMVGIPARLGSATPEVTLITLHRK